MLGAILKQVDHISQEIGAAFGRSRNQLYGGDLKSGEVLRLLVSSLRTMQRSYVCIDALDEVPREYRPELFKLLVQLTQESPGTRLFLTCRQYMREEISSYFTRGTEIRIEPTGDDIRNFLAMGFRNSTGPQAMNWDFREEILKTIPENIPKMWVPVSPHVCICSHEIY